MPTCKLLHEDQASIQLKTLSVTTTEMLARVVVLCMVMETLAIDPEVASLNLTAQGYIEFFYAFIQLS